MINHEIAALWASICPTPKLKRRLKIEFKCGVQCDEPGHYCTHATREGAVFHIEATNAGMPRRIFTEGCH